MQDDVVSKEELAQLTSWACAAFAARCALRIQCYYRGTPQRAQAVDAAIKLANAAAGYAAAAAHAAAASAAYYAARAAAEAAASGAAGAARRAVRMDFELLLSRSRTEQWTDFTPVPPEIFGPLWPDGPPANWPDSVTHVASAPVSNEALGSAGEAPTKQELLVELEIAVDANDESVSHLVSQVAQRINALHVAQGGSGLTIDDFQAWAPAEAPVEVGR